MPKKNYPCSRLIYANSKNPITEYYAAYYRVGGMPQMTVADRLVAFLIPIIQRQKEEIEKLKEAINATN